MIASSRRSRKRCASSTSATRAKRRRHRTGVDPTQLEQDRNYIRIGQDGRRNPGVRRVLVERRTRGYFLQPTLLPCHQQQRTSREEIFGPSRACFARADYDEALAIANDTEFGLTAGICTTSLKLATHFKRNAQAGMVMVNVPTAGVDFHVPFGGRKGSSYGPREQGRYAAEFYTTVKTAYTRVIGFLPAGS